MSADLTCHYCAATDCAMATPERKAETERNFGAQLDACGDVAVIDDTNVGPYPLEHYRSKA